MEAIRVIKSIRYQDYHLGKSLDKAPTDQEIMSNAAPFSCFDGTMCLWNLGKKSLTEDSCIINHESNWEFKPIDLIRKNLQE